MAAKKPAKKGKKLHSKAVSKVKTLFHTKTLM